MPSGQELRVKKAYGTILVVFCLLALCIVARVFYIQYIEGEELRAKGNRLVTRVRTVPPSRGNILADDGRLLVTSLPSYRVYMDLAPQGMTDEIFSENIDSLCLCLSSLFKDKSASEYRTKLVSLRRLRRRYVRIGNRDLNYRELKSLQKFPLLRLSRNVGGLIYEQSYNRLRPLGDLASRTLGKKIDVQYIGLEGAYNEVLRGDSGLRVEKRSFGNKWIPVGGPDDVPPIDGADLLTTIDINLQDAVDQALRSQLRLNGAHHGTVVVMEVATGDVKAIANLTLGEGGYYNEYERNYAVGTSTEPGSTFKVASLIALLEGGYITLDDTVDTGDGALRVFDDVISDTKEGGYGAISVRRVWELSSNVGVAKLVRKYFGKNESAFVDRLYAMHLNQPLGLPIKGEGRPRIKYPGDQLWSGLSLPMMSIGYEVLLTPMQILTFYNAIANDGRMVKPRFVTELLRDGQVVKRYPVEEIIPNLCSKKTLKQVREVLEGVVENGTASNLRAEKYRIAGKTGTAQIAHGKEGYKKGGRVSYQASFVGYFPADKPQYSCIVVVSSPTRHSYYGNRVAGPIFRKIVDQVYGTRIEWFPTLSIEKSMSAMYCKPGLSSRLRTSLAEMGVTVQDSSRATEWVDVQRHDNFVELKVPDSLPDELPGLVPDVRGFPLSDALSALENAGYRVRVHGRGSVRSQSIPAGTKRQRGAIIDLQMSVI